MLQIIFEQARFPDPRKDLGGLKITFLSTMRHPRLVLSAHLVSLGRNVVEADTVDAVALVGGRRKALSFENMSKVRATAIAQNFNPSSIRVGLLLKIC